MKWDASSLAALNDRLAEIPRDMRSKTAQSAAGKAMKIVTNAAKANALKINDPATAKNISSNITQRPSSKYRKRTGDVMIRVGVLGGARNYEAYGELKTGKSASENPGGDTFYWRFIEFGTKNIKARPFMRPALEENLSQVTDKFAEEVNKGIDRVIRKRAK